MSFVRFWSHLKNANLISAELIRPNLGAVLLLLLFWGLVLFW